MINLSNIGPFVAGAIIAATITSPLAAAEISLRSKAVCTSGIVRLGDLADLQGTAEEIAGLKGLELFPAPAMGATRKATAREIRELLMLRGIDLVRSPMNGSSLVQITSGSKEVNQSQVAPASASRVLANTDKTPASAPTAAAENMVVAASRSVRRGEVLHAGDLELVAAPKTRGDWVTEIDAALGLEITRAVSPGQPLERSTLQNPRLVKRGEVVSVHATGDGITVKTTAQALADGGRGDLVEVKSMLDAKTIYATRVIDWQTVEVAAQGPVVRRDRSPETR